MIAQVTTPDQKREFLRCLEGRLCLEPMVGSALELFWEKPAAGWQFFLSGTGGALALQGGLATLWGAFDREELASFLGFLGVDTLLGDSLSLEGWQKHSPLTAFTGQPLPGSAFPQGLTLDREPSLLPFARLVLRDHTGEEQENYYAQCCARKNHGRGAFYALRQGNTLVSGVSATWYKGWAYLSQGYTLPPFRGRGLGGALIAALARDLALQGVTPCLLCAPERRTLYRRMGFREENNYYLYKRKE